MDREWVINFLEIDPKNAYSYREIAEKLGVRMNRTFTVHAVREAVRHLMKEKPSRITRHMAKQPWSTLSGNTVQQQVAYYAIRRQKLVAKQNTEGQTNVPV